MRYQVLAPGTETCSMKNAIFILAASFLVSTFAAADSTHLSQAEPKIPEAHSELKAVMPSAELTPNRFGVRINTVETGLFAAVGHPLGSIAGDIRLGSRFVVGPLFAWGPLQKFENAKLGFWDLGIQGAVYFSGRAMQDGWFLRAYFTHFTAWATAVVNQSNVPVEAMGSVGFDALGGSIGYAWVWKSGVTLTLGIGAERFSSDTPSFSLSGTDPNSGAVVKTEVDLPNFAGQHIILPMPEITLGYLF